MFGLIITFLVGMTILSNIFMLLDGISGIIPTLFFIYFIVRMIKSRKEKTRTQTTVNASKTAANSNDTKVLKRLRDYFKTDARLYFDDNTYLTVPDNKEIRFEDIEIFMNDEFVGTMADYKLAFPNAYNTFLDMVDQYLRTKARKSRSTAQSKQAPVMPEAAAKQREEKKAASTKDASYYIDTINELNNAIENVDISNGLQETVLYLSQIKKIEDTFPDCKVKTTKLYQYYLPMLTDILQNYKRLGINANLHKEYTENEDRLRKTIVLINGALKTLSGNLCDEYYTELSTDMKTLETLLKKDGLASDELTFENYKSFDDVQQKQVNVNATEE